MSKAVLLLSRPQVSTPKKESTTTTSTKAPQEGPFLHCDDVGTMRILFLLQERLEKEEEEEEEEEDGKGRRRRGGKGYRQS